MVYLGVENVNSRESLRRGDWSYVRSVIRHTQSYPGRGYGFCGGYDISLIILEKGLANPRACLPSLRFQDSGTSSGKLAGYGRYLRKDQITLRDICETNQYGRSKFHYCREVREGFI